jgi:hypothetical protein
MKTLIAALLGSTLITAPALAFEQFPPKGWPPEKWPPEEITFCRIRDNKTGECIMIGECGISQPTPKEWNRFIRQWKKKGWQ